MLVGPRKVQFNSTRVRTLVFYFTFAWPMITLIRFSSQSKLIEHIIGLSIFEQKLYTPPGPTVNEAWLLLKWLKISFYSLRWKKFLAPLLHFRLILSHSLLLFLFLSLTLSRTLSHTHSHAHNNSHSLRSSRNNLNLWDLLMFFWALSVFRNLRVQSWVSLWLLVTWDFTF